MGILTHFFDVSHAFVSVRAMTNGMNQSIAYIVVLLLYRFIEFSFVFLAVFQAWKARNLSTEYHETESIYRALGMTLLVCFIGVPVLFLVDDNLDAGVFIASGIIFVACVSIQLVLFVPKMVYQRRQESESDDNHENVQVTGLMMDHSARIEESDSYTVHGERILSNKTRIDLFQEVSTLRRRIQILEDQNTTKENPEAPKGAAALLGKKNAADCAAENEMQGDRNAEL